MKSKGRIRWLVALLLAFTFIAAACGADDEETESTGDDETTTTEAAEGEGDDEGDGEEASGEDCFGEEGCIPPNQPDVNEDGTVKIGILSPGDTNDNGYYESFVVTAREFAEANDWELVIVDKINPADAAEQARNICRQTVDMVAIAASELADAIPVSEEDVCAGTVWYVAGGQGVEQTPYFFQTQGTLFEDQFVTGVAAGEVLKAQGGTKAGYITGPELDFSVNAFNAFTAGVKHVCEECETVATYTGDFDDSGVGAEAARSQISQGVEILYPYLGGATDAVADIGLESDVKSITPGTDRCAEEKFAISSIFSPGDFFAAALEDFEAGKVELGVTRTFRMGVDPVPTVKVCDSVEGAEDIQQVVDDTIQQVADGEIDPEALANEAAG